MQNTDFSRKLIIDRIEWERIQLIIIGRLKNISEATAKFSFVNLDTGETFAPKVFGVKDGKFFVKINVTIAYPGRKYIPDGRWCLCIEDSTGMPIKAYPGDPLFSNKGMDDSFCFCDDKNEILHRFRAVFAKNRTNYYSILPQVSEENALYFDVYFKAPEEFGVLKRILFWFLDRIKTVLYFINETGFKFIYYVSKAIIIKDGKRILFTSDSRDGLSGNLKNVYDRMCERGLDKEFKMIMMFKANVAQRRKFFDKFRMPWYLATSDIILIDDFDPTLYLVQYDKDVKIIQLWHACGAFKTVGYSRLGKPGGPSITEISHKQYTHAIASSSYVKQFYAEAFGMDEDMVYATGVPRTDVFFDEEYSVKTKARMLKAFPQANGKSVILFAPTFRGAGAKSANYPMSQLHLPTVADFCRKHNSVFIFKLHPFVTDKIEIPEDCRDVLIDATSHREINDILFITDLLITDYSSVIYEASALKIPMLFYAFDLEQYISTRDFYEPYETFVPGKIVKTFPALIKAIENKDFEYEKVDKFRNKNFEYHDNKSTDRVIDWLVLGNGRPNEKSADLGE